MHKSLSKSLSISNSSLSHHHNKKSRQSHSINRTITSSQAYISSSPLSTPSQCNTNQSTLLHPRHQYRGSKSYVAQRQSLRSITSPSISSSRSFSNQSSQDYQQQSPSSSPSSSSQHEDQTHADDQQVEAVPPKYRFPIPPQPLYRLPHARSISQQLFNPLHALNPKNQLFPDYASLIDFQDKESLLGWKIITDAELNGTSEATIAWGTAKNPVTGEQMRTLVFQGRIGNIILPNQLIQGIKTNHSIGSKFSSMFNKKETTEDAHGNLLKSIAADPNVDFGDQDDPYADHDYGAVHGFVGLMSPVFNPPLDLSFWDTFNICVKTDGGPWLASMKPLTVTNAELYMAGLPGPDGNVIYPRKPTGFLRKPMRNLFIPIENLSVTRAGRQSTRSAASAAHLFHGFGFSIRGPPGPFKIELGWIAVANSQGNIVAEESLTTPSPDIHIELTQNVIEHTATLNDNELFRFAHKNKTRMDELAKSQSILVQKSTQKNVLDTTAVINVEEIGSKQLSPEHRKKILAAKLGISPTEFEDLSQQSNPRDHNGELLDFRANMDQVEANDSTRAQSAIHTMTTYLSTTNSREDRLSMGLDLESGGRRDQALILTRGTDSSVQNEEELYRLQREARRLTGSDAPLIVPTYHDPGVMAQARISQLRLGLIDEKQWAEYTTTSEVVDMNKRELQLQEIDRKLIRQAFDSTWSQADKSSSEKQLDQTTDQPHPTDSNYPASNQPPSNHTPQSPPLGSPHTFLQDDTTSNTKH